MNFSPFGGHFPAAIPSIHQFAAKFSQEAAGPPPGLHAPQDAGGGGRYTANGVPSFTQHHPAVATHQQQQAKYQPPYVNQGLYGHHAVSRGQDKRPSGYEHQELAQELCAAMLQQHQHQQPDKHAADKQKHDAQEASDRRAQSAGQQQQAGGHPLHQVVGGSQHGAGPPGAVPQTQGGLGMPTAWQSLAAPGSTVADYLSHLPASTLPLSLHHFLKYSAESIKKETAQQLAAVASSSSSVSSVVPSAADPALNLLHAVPGGAPLNGLGGPVPAVNGVMNPLNHGAAVNAVQNAAAPPKKKKKRKQEKEKKPRPKPGEIRLTTALDGSTLFCCPECHMAYPEKELLEQHLVGHTLERRFVCDICGAGLKRKDHLTRHKQSHNPERPYVCTVCLKAFKRKEQLTLHFVIHSGEKRHICSECGKGFYRKDHLRKHTRSHIARRVKAELSQQGAPAPALQIQVAAPTPAAANAAPQGILS